MRQAAAQDLYVGSNSSGETTTFSLGTNVYGNIFVGYTASDSGNTLQLFNPGTTLIDNVGIFIGYYGSGNAMDIASGAQEVSEGYAWIGGNYTDASSFTASNNSVVVTGSNSSWTINNGDLTVGVYGAGNSLLISNGAQVTINGGYGWVGGNGYGTNGDYNGDVNSATSSNNKVIVTGNGSLWSVNYDVVIGTYGSGNIMEILDGGTVAAQGNGWIGGNGVYRDSDATNSLSASNNIVIVSGVNEQGAHSTWSNGGNITVGLYGPNNELIISNGGIALDDYGWVGGNSAYGDPIASTSSNNVVIVTGNGSMWSNVDDITIGVYGGGNKVIVADGAELASYYGWIGGNGTSNNVSSSNNFVLVTGSGSLWTNQADVTVGNYTTGNSLIISDGGQVIDQNGWIGGNGIYGDTNSVNASSNSVLVTGNNSLWSNSSDITVGVYGAGNSLIISNGGTVTSFNGWIGGDQVAQETTCSNNRVLVTGSNSLWNIGGGLNVGFTGSSNELLIANGGQVLVANSGSDSFIGNGSSNNIVLVTGNNSLLSNGGNLYIGGSGSGNQLIISNGGTVLIGGSYQCCLGNGGDASNNSAIVTGSHSLWSNASTLYVGNYGSGSTLTIADGGTVIAPTLIIGEGSSSNTLNFGSFGGNDGGGNLVASSITFGSGSSNVINFNQTNTVTLTSSISGFGFVNQLGSGTTIISGNNSYTGVTHIQNGTLVVQGSSSLGSSDVILQGTVQTIGTLSVGDDSTPPTIPNLSWGSNGVVAVTPGSNSLIVAGLMSNSGGGGSFNIDPLAAGNTTNLLITFGSQSGFTSDSYTIAGISGYSFIQDEITKEVLGYLATNANLVVSTNCTISSNAAQLSSMTIATEGNVNGIGNLNGNLTNNGTLAPGYSTGTLTINGNFTQNSSGILQINVADSNTYGTLQVNGNTALSGMLKITPINQALAYGEKLTFINSTGPIKGNFDTIQIDQAGCRGRVQIIGDPQAIVTIAPASYTLVAQNQNQTNVATALNSFIPATSGDELVVSTALDELTASQYPAAFNQIMPSLYQSLSTIAFNQANAQNMELIQRLWGARMAGGGFSMGGFGESMPLLQEQTSQQKKNDILRPGTKTPWGVFIDGNGIFSQANSGNALPTYNTESGGVTTGLTYHWNEHAASGLYSGYQGNYTKFNGSASGSLISDSVLFGLFGTYALEKEKGLYLDGLIGGGYGGYTMQRNINFGTISRTATGNPGAGTLNAMLATGYDLKKGNWIYGPTMNLQYAYFGVPSFNETGAQSLDLQNVSWNTSSMIYSLGSHLAYRWEVNKSLALVPQINLSWQHEFLQNSYDISANLGGINFNNASSAPLRDTLYTGVGFSLEFEKKWNASLFYNAVAGNSDLMSQNIFLSLGMRF